MESARFNHVRFHLLLPLWLVCCAAPRPPAMTGADVSPVRVSVHVDAIVARGERRSLAVGGTLRSGDSYVLAVGVDRPAYVYVTQVSPGGVQTVLFPTDREADQQVTPGELMSIPPQGESFQLDDNVGVENLYVVFSPQPIGQVARWTSQHLGLAAVASAEQPSTVASGTRGVPEKAPPPPPPPPKPRDPPPPPVTVAERGTWLSGKDGAVRVQAGETGIAVVRFWFQHEPSKQGAGLTMRNSISR